MNDDKLSFEGTLALASATGGGGDDLPPSPKLSRSSLNSLGSRLRAMYELEMAEPLPQHFLELLNQESLPKRSTIWPSCLSR
jgi:hypothetical protein